MSRPDYSEYVAHFTSFVAVKGEDELSAMDPLARLANILSEKRVRATKKWWALGEPSVAFTECPWTSLLDHASKYSACAIGFDKSQLWSQGGQPALYVRSEVLRSIRDHVRSKAGKNCFPEIPLALGTFYTPIEREPGWKMLDGSTVETQIDFSQEREWRVPADFQFEYDDIRFLIVDKVADVAQLPAGATEALGDDRILLMSNYRRIEKLWPTHRVTGVEG